MGDATMAGRGMAPVQASPIPGTARTPAVDNGVVCVSCGSANLASVVRIEELPVHVGVLWPTREAATACPVGEMHLGFCSSCGLLTNTSFDPGLLDYTLDYDNSLHASAVFREFESALIEDLVQRYDLHDREIVEIGSGAGRFLDLLCSAGDNRGIGFDPSIGVDRTISNGRVQLRAEFFTESTQLDSFDLLCCRQVLEHVMDLRGFLDPIVSAMASHRGAAAYFDVPNATMLLRDLSIWDLVYEHCHYFVEESLAALMVSCGLEPDRSWTSFGDQFLSLEVGLGAGRGAGTARPAGEVSVELAETVEAFADHMDARRREWTDRLARERSAGHRIAVWGAGARAVSFFSMLGVTDEISYLVDANEAKQGTFLAGTGHSIHAPARLAEDPVDLVVLLNGIYEAEITRGLDDMGVASTLVVV